MARYHLSRLAERDIEAILEWTHDRWGKPARLRYEALLSQAIVDVATDPTRPGSRARPEIAPGARTYHLRYSRDRGPKSVGKVKHPRHFVLYRLLADGQVQIGRILHDSMELTSHLPDEN